MGPQVGNQRLGIIDTPQGRALFAAGQRVTLDLDDGHLLGGQIQGEQVIALLQNGRLVRADGGAIQQTAHGKDALMNTAIDNSGILQLRGLTEKNGIIYLDGGGDTLIKGSSTAGSSAQGEGG